MISKGKLTRLKQLAEHKLAIANTSVTGPIRLASIDAKDLLELVEIAEAHKRQLHEMALGRRALRRPQPPTDRAAK
ncbi:hypothetical protein [Tardiphaga sp.]|jgi:hypothetical protein|uniref:hypothetical protein n=1 Tax=Tardiphaga sp. TaxID=1926292 RepID=UPI0037D9CB49